MPSLTTESNKDYTQKLKLKIFLPKLIILESRDHCDSKIMSIRHPYLNIKINNQRKILHP